MRIARHSIRHPWQIAGLIAGAAIGFLLIVLASIVPFRSEAARLRVVAALAEHLESDVELKELRWRVLPQLRAEGIGLTIRHKGRTDVPPLISVQRFAVEGNVHDLNSEALDFAGTLTMDAKVSETVTGVKRVLLKVVDPLFKKEGGGSAIPIKISGTRNDPSFGLDKGRVFKRK